MLTHNQSSQLKRFMKRLFLNVPISTLHPQSGGAEDRGGEQEASRDRLPGLGRCRWRAVSCESRCSVTAGALPPLPYI